MQELTSKQYFFIANAMDVIVDFTLLLPAVAELEIDCVTRILGSKEPVHQHQDGILVEGMTCLSRCNIFFWFVFAFDESEL